MTKSTQGSRFKVLLLSDFDRPKSGQDQSNYKAKTMQFGRRRPNVGMSLLVSTDA